MKERYFKFSILVGVLLCFVVCREGDKVRRNYNRCCERIIAFSKTLDPKSDSYSIKLNQKVLELCNIYDFGSLDELKNANTKYGDNSSGKLAEILNTIKDSDSSLLSLEDQRKVGTNENIYNKNPISDISNKALSLKVLQQKLKENHGKSDLSGDISQFIGINRIFGYVLDEPNQDIILLGMVDKMSPSVFIEDFVIALRNAWLKYAELQDNTCYYSNPGCTIDPDPNVLKKLDRIATQINSQQVENGINQWKETCNSPQTVGVFGVPFDSRFSWVMVKADYDMKRLVDGSDSPGIPEFSSLVDMELEHAKENIIGGNIGSHQLSSMSRFWFYPGENQYLEDEGIVLIDECNVALFTEEEYLTESGNVVGRGRSNSYAQEFTELFSALYQQISKQRPIYAELENLFRFVALAKILKTKSPHTSVGLDIDYLLNQFPVSSTPVEKHLPGRSNVKGFTHLKEYKGGYQTYQLWLPSCGGVSINIQEPQNNFAAYHTDVIKKLKKAVIKNRPSPNALSWDFDYEVITNDHIQGLIQKNRLNRESSLNAIVVNYFSHYKVYSDSLKPAYEGNDISVLFKKMRELLSPTQDLYLEMVGFSPEKAELLAASLRFQKEKQNSNIMISIIPREDNYNQIRDTFFNKSHEILILSKAKPVLEEIKIGKYKGWFKMKLKFLVKIEDIVKEIFISFVSASSEALYIIYDKLRFKFSSPTRNRSLDSIIRELRRNLMNDSKGKTREGIITELEDQLGNIHFVYMHSLRYNQNLLNAS